MVTDSPGAIDRLLGRVAGALAGAAAFVLLGRALVVGAMSAGWATPTEAAAIRALATMTAAACYRALTLEAVKKSLTGTTATSGMILFIVMAATTFSQILSFSGATAGLVNAVSAQGLPPAALLGRCSRCCSSSAVSSTRCR